MSTEKPEAPVAPQAPDCLSNEALAEVKDRLAPDVLAYYLHEPASRRYSRNE